MHSRRPPAGIVRDMDSSVSPTHGEQEMSVWNGHYQCSCYPLFVFNQFGELEHWVLCPSNVHSADGWEGVFKPVTAKIGFTICPAWARTDRTRCPVRLSGRNARNICPYLAMLSQGRPLECCEQFAKVNHTLNVS